MNKNYLALAAIGGLVLWDSLAGKKAGAKTIEPQTTPAPTPTPSPFEEALNKYWATPAPAPDTGYTLMEAVSGTQKGKQTWIPNDSVQSFLEGGEWQIAGATSNAIDKALVDTTAGAKTIEPQTTPTPTPTPSPFEEALNKYWAGMPTIEPEAVMSKDLDWYAQIVANKPGMATIWNLTELQQALTNPSYTQFFVPYKPDSKTMTAMAVAIISAKGNNAPPLLVQQWPGFVTTFGLANALEASQVWGVTVEQLLIGYGWW